MAYEETQFDKYGLPILGEPVGTAIPTSTVVENSGSRGGNAALAGSITGLVTGALGMMSVGSDIEQANEALMTNMESEGESIAFRQSVRASQLSQLSEALGEDLTEIGLETLKLESTARAEGAESGSTNMSEDKAMAVAMDATFEKAKRVKEHEIDLVNVLTAGEADLLSYENRIESMLSTQLTAEQAGLRTASAGMSGMNSGMIIGRNIGSF